VFGDRGRPLKPPRRHRWLLLLPFVWQIGLAPFANVVTMKPLYLPFPMLWQMAGIVFATLVIAGVRWLDARYDARHGGDAENQQ
jgi:hypothetical protein